MTITKDNFKCYRPVKNRIVGRHIYYRKGIDQKWAKYIPWGRVTRGANIETQRFGANAVPFYKDLGMLGHNGIDWTAYIDTCLYATISGTIYDIQNKSGYGKYIRIKSDTFNIDGVDHYFMAIEGHLNDIFVKKGDVVKHGDFIGLTGNTGKYTTGAHLHEGFRLYKKINNEWVADMDNGYMGYVNHRSLIDNRMVKAFKCFQNARPYVQITDEVGGFYKVDDADLEELSSHKDPITRRIPLVDELIYSVLNRQNLNEGITTEEYNQIIKE